MAMQNLKNLTRARGLENAIITSILLFVFNIVSPLHSDFVFSLINEVLVFATLYFLYKYIHPFLSSKTDSPLSLVLNAGILGALIFFIISVSNSLFDFVANDGKSISVFNSLFAVILSFVFLGALIYIFSTFRELFFLRQKNDHRIYFNTMLVFFSLTFFSNILLKINPEFDYPHDAFYVVTIVLISLNSLRVAWIAFLVKKQKLYLLIISVVLSLLFGFNFALLNESNAIKQILYTFSPGLFTVLSLVMIYGTIYFSVIFFTTLFHLPTAEAFDRKAEEITSLMDLTNLITQVFDFKELAGTISSNTIKVCNSYAAWLVTKKENELELNSVKNIAYVDADNLTKQLMNEEEINYDSLRILYFDSVSSELKSAMKEFKSVAVAPLKVHGEINGYLFTARLQDVNFDEDEKKSIQTFADYAAVALENAKLIAESIEKERLEKELDVARDIQNKILPSVIPQSENLQISALFIPAFEVGGDYYDFFALDENRLGFTVCDVSGKGISAAFIMAEVKGIFETLSKLIHNPKELLEKANDVLKKSLDKKSFVTAIYGIIDKKNRTLVFSRAGHSPAILCSDNEIKRLQPAGIGLGLDYSNGFANTLKEMQIELQNNDIIAFYSDGIPEAKNSDDEDFGYERFENIILRNRNKSLDEISNQIMKEVTIFTKDHSQHDDITLVLFKWNSNN
jgi:phosphoserine phosphatase RsbU/P